jgi:hypothetical protein
LQSASIGVRLITIFTFDSCFHDSRGQKSIIRIVCLISDNVAIHVSLRQQINLQQSMLRSWNRKNIFIVVVVVVVVVETVQTIATSAATTNDAVATTNDDDDDGALSADVSAVTLDRADQLCGRQTTVHHANQRERLHKPKVIIVRTYRDLTKRINSFQFRSRRVSKCLVVYRFNRRRTNARTNERTSKTRYVPFASQSCRRRPPYRP